MNDLQIALELYTVRDETKQDFAGTLQRVSQSAARTLCCLLYQKSGARRRG